jgi:hypothetical protein
MPLKSMQLNEDGFHLAKIRNLRINYNAITGRHPWRAILRSQEPLYFVLEDDVLNEVVNKFDYLAARVFVAFIQCPSLGTMEFYPTNAD